MTMDYSTEKAFNQVVLRDRKNGKKNDWKKHKKDSEIIGGSYGRLGDARKGERVLSCCSFLEFREYETGEKRLHMANFCKVRLCPLCAWRRSIKLYHQFSAVMGWVEARESYQYIFLTLTVRNMRGELLAENLDRMYKAYHKFIRLKAVMEVFRGSFRALEITHNKKRGDYHPHFHVIVAVGENYGKKGHQYIKQKDFIAASVVFGETLSTC